MQQLLSLLGEGCPSPHPCLHAPMQWPRRPIEQGRGAGSQEPEGVHRSGAMACGQGLRMWLEHGDSWHQQCLDRPLPA